MRPLSLRVAASALAMFAIVSNSQAAPVTKAATGTDLTAGASWGGTVPGSGDVATWASTSLGAGLALGTSSSWGGIGVASAMSDIGITGTGTLTLGSGGINMSSSTVNLDLGTPIALGASQTWTVNSGRTLAASGIISGTSMGLTKTGLGTLTIKNAANTFSGGTIINAGQLTLDIQANAALGTGPITLNGGRLFLERITAANALTVNGGDLYPENGFGDNWNGPVTLNSNLIIQGPGYATMTFNGSISGAGGLTLNGQGPVVLGVANSYTGPTSVTACTLQCNHKDALGSGALSISGTPNSKVNLNYTGTRNIASLILGGVPQSGGTHGSTTSPAANKNDTCFSGNGTVTVPLSPAKNILTFNFGALGTDAQYQYGAFPNNTLTGMTLTFTGLNSSKQYLFQFGYGDKRTSFAYNESVVLRLSDGTQAVTPLAFGSPAIGDEYALLTAIVTNTTSLVFYLPDTHAGNHGPTQGGFSVHRFDPPSAPPTGLTATAGVGQVSLTWTAPANTTGYMVKRSLASGNEVAIEASATTNYTDAPLTNGVRYYYVVSATNSAGVSTNSSNEVSARPLPAAAPKPALLSGTAGFSLGRATGAQFTISNGMGGIQYRITYTSDLASGIWTPLAWLTCANSGTGLMTLMDTNVPLATRRFYRIEAQLP